MDSRGGSLTSLNLLHCFITRFILCRKVCRLNSKKQQIWWQHHFSCRPTLPWKHSQWRANHLFLGRHASKVYLYIVLLSALIHTLIASNLWQFPAESCLLIAAFQVLSFLKLHINLGSFHLLLLHLLLLLCCSFFHFITWLISKCVAGGNPCWGHPGRCFTNIAMIFLFKDTMTLCLLATLQNTNTSCSGPLSQGQWDTMCVGFFLQGRNFY